jgi:hypothetical protein
MLNIYDAKMPYFSLRMLVYIEHRDIHGDGAVTTQHIEQQGLRLHLMLAQVIGYVYTQHGKILFWRPASLYGRPIFPRKYLKSSGRSH